MSGTKLNRLSGIAALMVAQTQPLHKLKGEHDTEFVKRIVGSYLQMEQERLAIMAGKQESEAYVLAANMLFGQRPPKEK
jgi:hypothetical protein